MSLAAGDDKHFFFVLPQCADNGIQYGALKDDLTPYPSFVALSTAANILGLSEYLGEYKIKGNAVAQCFSTPNGNVLVAWSDKATEITIPTDKHLVRMANILGDETRIAAKDGVLKVKVGPDAVYLIGVGDQIKQGLSGKPIPMGKLPTNKPSRIVVVGHSDLHVQKLKNCYMLDTESMRRFTYDVEVYNFRQDRPVDGNIGITAPTGWRVEEPRRSVHLDPMGREALTFKIAPAAIGLADVKVVVNAHFGREHVRPAVSHFQTNPAVLTPIRRQSLGIFDASRWQPSIDAGGTVTVTTTSPKTLRFEVSYRERGDHWAYPVFQFPSALDISQFDGIAFDLNANVDDMYTYVRMVLTKPNGAKYLTGTSAFKDKRRVVFLFKDMKLMEWQTRDPEHNLGQKIASMALGCNTAGTNVVFDVDNPELVKLGK
jgi:hypothetical protein